VADEVDVPEIDPALWRPVALKDGDPGEFAYLLIHEVSDSEVLATVYRWPRIDANGNLRLEEHCALRAKPPRRNPLRRRKVLVDHRRGLHVPSRTPLGPGEIVAASPSSTHFWDKPLDLEDWRQFSPPLIRITEEAREVEYASFEPLCWTLWRDWLGQAPLIAHVARLAGSQLSQQVGGSAKISIEARVAMDTEEFSSPEDYLALATPQALEKPDSVLVTARAEHLWARVSVARRQDRERSWLKNAVLLEAGSSEPRQIDTVKALHVRLAAALRRGEPHWLAKGSSTSVSGYRPRDEDGEPREIPEAWREKAQRRSSRLLATVVGIGGALIGAFANFGLVAVLIAGGACGLLIGGVLTLWPGVEFTARRSERISRFALKGLLAPLVGAVGATLVRVFSEGGL
jgi:hypothetical protein